MTLSVLSLLALSTLTPALAFATDCTGEVKTAVETQAWIDFKAHLVAVVPTLDTSGGLEQDIRVPVIQPADPNTTLATYRVLVGETCQIMSLAKD